MMYTILIPTFNRPGNLSRILNYYNGFGKNFTIIVGDSSSTKTKKENKKVIESMLNLDVTHLDHYSSSLVSLTKFGDMTRHIKSPYAVFCADDDFIVPSGIKQSVEFLEKSPDFVCAQGDILRFRVSHDRNNVKQFLWRYMYPRDSISFPDSALRVRYHLSNYKIPTTYAVHRTNVLQKIYSDFLQSKTDPLAFGELLPSVLTLVQGKFKTLNVFYGARDATPSESSLAWPNLRQFIKEGTYDEKYATFQACLAKNLEQKSSLSSEESEQLVDESMAEYLKNHVNFNRATLRHLALSTASRIVQRLPKPIKHTVRSVYSKTPANEFSGSEKNKDFVGNADFERVREHVLSNTV